MPHPQYLLIANSLIDTDIPATIGHVLVRCHDNRWRFIDELNPRRQQRGKIVGKDHAMVTFRLTIGNKS